MSHRGPQTPSLAFEDAQWRQQFRVKLLRWYRQARRDLPWRRHSDPYAIWVSEIMLHQTQVATAERYFVGFMRRFPTIGHLACATEAEVLRLWEGLGYYRRARQLHAAAQQIVDRHGGKFPANIDDVLALPGIGRYTAGAILSIALDQRQPILEANTYRLMSRLCAYRGDPLKADGQQLLWRMAELLMPRKNCGDFNQALMELGSLVCTPRSPDCQSCPVSKLCPAHELSLQNDIPTSKKKIDYEEVTEVALVITRGQRVVLRECGPGERWAGLWDFPRFPIGRQNLQRAKAELASKVQRQTGLEVSIKDQLTTMKHGVTKYRITLHCLFATPTAGQRLKQPAKWVPVRELDAYPLSVTGRKICRLAF